MDQLLAKFAIVSPYLESDLRIGFPDINLTIKDRPTQTAVRLQTDHEFSPLLWTDWTMVGQFGTLSIPEAISIRLLFNPETRNNLSVGGQIQFVGNTSTLNYTSKKLG